MKAVRQGTKSTDTNIFKATLVLWKENPAIVFLFFLVAVVDLLALLTLYWAPSEPVSGLLAPIIRTFWDDRYLHYPENFMLLPKLFKHAHFLILCTFGILVSGVVIKQIEAQAEGRKLSLLSAASVVFRKYFFLLAAWLVSYAVFTFAIKILMKLIPSSLIPQVVAGFAVSLVLQSLVIYLLPALLILNGNFFKVLAEGFLFGVRNLVSTALIIALPVFCAVGISFAKATTPMFVQTYPEAILWILLGSIFVSMIVDLFMTSATTLHFLKVRNKS